MVVVYSTTMQLFIFQLQVSVTQAHQQKNEYYWLREDEEEKRSEEKEEKEGSRGRKRNDGNHCCKLYFQDGRAAL